MVILRVVRAAVLTGFLAAAFLLLVVVGSAVATDGVAVSPSCTAPLTQCVPARITLVGDATVLAAQTETTRAPAQNTGSVVQKTGPAAAATARTIDIIVVASLAALALWVWVRNASTRKGH
ncbi:hypothetical protein [Umezawaea sp.]|uniref:hypothetical protein n=1 Tax=Umezawaea sp. TaxID=1955258 RepID=UPI002ED5426E